MPTTLGNKARDDGLERASVFVFQQLSSPFKGATVLMAAPGIKQSDLSVDMYSC